jgi:membrane-associated phospholipid phosphatase
MPLRVLAAAVAYSRVHTGVHYPADVVMGAVLGVALAQMTTGVRAAFVLRAISNATLSAARAAAQADASVLPAGVLGVEALHLLE